LLSPLDLRQEGNGGEGRKGLGGGGEGKGREREDRKGEREKLRHGRWGDRRPWLAQPVGWVGLD